MRTISILFLVFIAEIPVLAQDYQPPLHTVGKVLGDIKLNGDLSEDSWQEAPVLTNLKTTVPIEGGEPTGVTEVRILAEAMNIYIGIICFDPDPSGIVSFSKLRDVDLQNEDHIRIVLDPSKDGQSGYIFGVNPSAARYDALVSNRGESENKNWDGVWEAKTAITENGWLH